MLLSIVCFGCSGTPEQPDGGSADTGIVIDTDLSPEADADHDPDTDLGRLDGDRSEDGDILDVDIVDEPDAEGPVEARPPYLRLTLDDGRELGGEHLYTYDHSLWWDPSDSLTYALFDPTRYAEHPADRSVSFTSSLIVESIVEEALEPAVTTYQDFLRDLGVIIEGVPLDGVVFVITGHERYHLEENGYGDFAFDLVRTDDSGRRFTGMGLANEDFLVWDDEVYLPADGQVVEVVRDGSDNEQPGVYPVGAINNMVGVRLRGSFHLYLLHFREGSIPDDIVVGVTLTRGTYLGRVGNSGVSLEPHLHMALLFFDRSSEPRSWSVPVEMTGIHSSPSPTGPSALEEYAAPLGGSWISNETF